MKKNLIFLLLLITLSFATKPTVAILYFNNRSIFDSKTDLNKALADIVITELTNQSSFKIIEREELERVAKELDFSESYLIKQSTAPEVGKVLGATYIFTGAYMVEEEEILVTMKMLRVETGEIVAGDNLTGDIKKISKMIGKLSKSALGMLEKEGLSTTSTKQIASSKMTIHDIEIYNRSLVLKDNGELEAARNELKKMANSVPYADRTLQKIEQELKKAESAHDKEMQKLDQTNMTYMEFITLSSDLMMQMKYHALYALCDKIRENGLVVPEAMMINGSEIVEQYAITAATQMKAWDLVITDGTAFLKTHPKSLYFSSIKISVKQAFNHIQKEKLAEEELAPQVAKLENKNTDHHSKNYQIGVLYYEKALYEKAGSYFINVDATKAAKTLSETTADKILFEQLMCFYNLLDIESVKTIYEKMQKLYPESPYLTGMSGVMDYIRTIE